ncbi:MAG: hypothetical protein Kow0077_13280 [Anaerolineae bacterium]
MEDKSQEHILHMLQNGTISAEEADRLLQAIETDRVAEEVPHEPLPAINVPRASTYRAGWKVPFVGSLMVVAVSSMKLLSLRGKQGVLANLNRNTTRLIFGLGVLGALLSVWSREARWLRIKIEDRDGPQVDIALPVPVHLIGWVLRTLRPLVDPDTAARIDSGLEVIQALGDEMDRPDGQPIIVDINEDDNRVQIFFI